MRVRFQLLTIASPLQGFVLRRRLARMCPEVMRQGITTVDAAEPLHRLEVFIHPFRRLSDVHGRLFVVVEVTRQT